MIESSINLTHFFDLSIDMFCIAGMDGYFKRINSTFAQTLGYSQAELLAKPFIDFIHPADVAVTMAEIAKLTAGTPTTYFESRFRCQDGTYKWLAWTANPAGDLIFAVAREISNQKQLNSALEKSESLFRALFQSAAIGTLLVSEQGEILEVNQKARDIFAYDEGELSGAPIERLLPKHMADVHRQHRTDFIAQPHVRPMGINMELIGCRRDGSEFPVEVGLSFVNTSEETLVLAFVIDITPRKQYEAEREKLVEELEAFAHTVAHDLKSPLGLILGYANLLRVGYDDITAPEINTSLNLIENTSQKMSNIINELLMLASIRDIEEVEVTALDMKLIILEAQNRLQPMISEFKASFILQENWPVCRGYAPWIEEIWVNYISNGLKYGGQPPQLEIGADAQPDGMIRYWISDNGLGIEPAQISFLFNRFTRLEQQRAEGHGLGLSIVRRIVEKLGGKVGVDSERGKGSTFYFTLPRY